MNVLNIWMEEDHVHLYISIPVSKPIPLMIQKLKWTTSKTIREDFKKDLEKYYHKNILWARWYFIATVWEISDDIIKNYVDKQWKEEVFGKEIEL